MVTTLARLAPRRFHERTRALARAAAGPLPTVPPPSGDGVGAGLRDRSCAAAIDAEARHERLTVFEGTWRRIGAPAGHGRRHLCMAGQGPPPHGLPAARGEAGRRLRTDGGLQLPPLGFQVNAHGGSVWRAGVAVRGPSRGKPLNVLPAEQPTRRAASTATGRHCFARHAAVHRGDLG
jgi:hypothetical protein